MRRGVTERKHRAPGMSNDRRFPATTPQYHFVKIRDMLRDRERNISTTSLQWLNHTKGIFEFAGDSRHIARSTGASMQKYDARPVRAVLADMDRRRRHNCATK
jgi:hypothetical protein